MLHPNDQLIIAIWHKAALALVGTHDCPLSNLEEERGEGYIPDPRAVPFPEAHQAPLKEP